MSSTEKICVNKEALRQVLNAFQGPSHHVLELWAINAPYIDNPVTKLIEEFNNGTTPPARDVKPSAYVPVHPKKGPLWVNTTADPNPERLPSYPLMELCAALPAQEDEPVGFRWRKKGSSDKWRLCRIDLFRAEAAPMIDYEFLYTRPSHPDGEASKC